MGIFYQALTQFLGFKNYGDEYKVMGLAPYGRKDDKIPDLFYKDTKRGDKNLFIAAYPRGSYIDTERYPYLAHSNGARNEWHGNPAKITDAQKNIAWKVQQETQEDVGDMIEKAVDMTGEDNICISGGYGLNVVANYYYNLGKKNLVEGSEQLFLLFHLFIACIYLWRIIFYFVPIYL